MIKFITGTKHKTTRPDVFIPITYGHNIKCPAVYGGHLAGLTGPSLSLKKQAGQLKARHARSNRAGGERSHHGDAAGAAGQIADDKGAHGDKLEEGHGDGQGVHL